MARKDEKTNMPQTPQQSEQLPASGGSYVRLPDGTLVPANQAAQAQPDQTKE